MVKKKRGRPPKVPPFMSVTEVAELFEITPATVREWCREGRISATKPGRDWKIVREDVLAMAQSAFGSEEE